MYIDHRLLLIDAGSNSFQIKTSWKQNVWVCVGGGGSEGAGGEGASISTSCFLLGPFLRRYLKGKSNYFIRWNGHQRGVSSIHLVSGFNRAKKRLIKVEPSVKKRFSNLSY